MTDLEPVEPDAILLRRNGSGVPPDRWRAAMLSRSRISVASGIRRLADGPLLATSALTVAALAAAKAAARAARRSGAKARPSTPEAVGRVLGPPARGGTLQLSWTHVEIRWRE